MNPCRTDPTGKSFLSYCRTRAHEAGLLIAAQHRLGIPTWIDTQDLGPGPTEPQISDTLNAPTTANAILWLTADVSESDYIQRIEAPLILDRAASGNGFFCLPVAAGGLDYSAAAATLDPRFNFHDLRTWNLHPTAAASLTDAEATSVATRVLRTRLKAICARPAQADPLRLRLTTRGSIGFTPGIAVDMDWRDEFKAKQASGTAWNDRLLPALKTVGDALASTGRPVEASGQLSLVAAAALGLVFRGPRQTALSWCQYFPGKPEQLWSLAPAPETVPLTSTLTPGLPDSEHLAVLVAVAASRASLRNDFNLSSSSFPAFRAKLELHAPDGQHFFLAGPDAAHGLARQIVTEINHARDQHPGIRTVHLFMAVPSGLAVLVGQLLNKLPMVQFYEHVPDAQPGPYQPAFKLNPSIWPD